MLFRKSTALILSVLSIFLITLFTGISDAKTSDKKPKPPTKPWAQINGFRSAKFGMDQEKVMRAIARDFKISKSKVKQSFHHSEGTTILLIQVPNLLAAGGNTNIGYVFGLSTKKLIRVNVLWGKGVGETTNNKSVLAVANNLRDHYSKKRYQEKTFLLNGKMNDTTMLFFRGQDKKNRMITLMFKTPAMKKGAKLTETDMQVSLKLAYVLNPTNPDVLTIRYDDF